jgi:hypothetical protein
MVRRDIRKRSISSLMPNTTAASDTGSQRACISADASVAIVVCHGTVFRLRYLRIDAFNPIVYLKAVYRYQWFHVVEV